MTNGPLFAWEAPDLTCVLRVPDNELYIVLLYVAEESLEERHFKM